MGALYVWNEQSDKFSSQKSQKIAKDRQKRDFLLYTKIRRLLWTPPKWTPPKFWSNIMKVLINTNILMYNTWYLRPYNTNRPNTTPRFILCTDYKILQLTAWTAVQCKHRPQPTATPIASSSALLLQAGIQVYSTALQ